ncbi:MAG: alpha-amylase family glycosyl hydrolase [Acidobacteriota bacterium]
MSVGASAPRRLAPRQRMLAHLVALYGDRAGAGAWDEIERLIDGFTATHPALARRRAASPRDRLTQADNLLITYGDSIRPDAWFVDDGAPGDGVRPDGARPAGELTPLGCLGRVLRARVGDVVRGVHLLPFFPYSSDYGFSVIDYRAVNPDVGTWADVARLAGDVDLCFDAVVNHVSSQSPWFQGYLANRAPWRDYFLSVAWSDDLSKVARPRATKLRTPFETARGTRHVWTTFGPDQIDLNFQNPDVLIEMLDVLLGYAARGARMLRLDAIGYLWKEVGTSCIHRPETHRVIQLLRAMFEAIAPDVLLLTETNVPQDENLSYFGDGHNEAQLVYQFALPPLTLHAFMKQDARKLARWASELATPSDETTFLNFLASHDGIGLRPVEGLVNSVDVAAMIRQVQHHGGFISLRSMRDGRTAPYEMNVNFFDALSSPTADEPLDHQVMRFIAAHALMIAQAGIPAIYIHSLLGSRGWRAGVLAGGENRVINRRPLALGALEAELDDPTSLRRRVLDRLLHLLRVRAAHAAFHPQAPQRVAQGEGVDPGLFALLRGAGDGRVLAVHNVADRAQRLAFPPALMARAADGLRNLLADGPMADGAGASIRLDDGALVVPPRGVRWVALPGDDGWG